MRVLPELLNRFMKQSGLSIIAGKSEVFLASVRDEEAMGILLE